MEKGRVVITGGRLLDPANSKDGFFDVAIEEGRVAEILPGRPEGASKRAKADTVIDATDKLVMPGLIDLHTHLRQPGREDKETIESGLRAAVCGGYTTVCAMPNTEPAIDNAGVVEFIKQEALRVGLADVLPIGAITKGRAGKELTDFEELFDAGCVGLSDDGSPLADSLLMRRALEYARIFGRPIIQHAEDMTLSAGGVMHEGLVSATLGLRGIPSESESVIVARDIALAELTGGWLHVAHVSCAKSVELIRQAKRRGVKVTCEVTPHHIALTDAVVENFDTHAKVNPPVRSEQDRMALIAGICDGTVDAIATDHAPHTDWEKDASFDEAPFGISGLETALAVCVDALVTPGHLGWGRLVELLSTQPARIAGIQAGKLNAGAVADITLVDPKQHWCVDPQAFASKGRHSPFRGRELLGRVVCVMKQGRMLPMPETASVD